MWRALYSFKAFYKLFEYSACILDTLYFFGTVFYLTDQILNAQKSVNKLD